MTNVIEIVAQILRVPAHQVTAATSMETHAAWDSLSHMDIITALERALKIEFTGDEMVEMTSVAQIQHILLQ
ncbi:MAG: acyl carrier protein, partial [Gammaproteobacteria bacterium]|nr:acyl carrier protein [Gammaproteobacteria bacterium]